MDVRRGQVGRAPGDLWENLTGAEQLVTILDVDGTRVMIVAWTIGSLRDEVAETRQVMDSIDFQ